MSIDFDGLKAKTDIVEVIGSFIPLRKRGAEFLGLCPFHEDHNPSFYVVPAKRMYHCFACDESGDVIDFVAKYQGVDLKEAARTLGAENVQWRPKADIPYEKVEAPRPERITSKPPADAGEPQFNIRWLGGEPKMKFTIRDVNGDVLGYECRYELEGKKEPRIWTWGARGDAPPSWGMGHFNVPRPLYGLERLADKPTAQVSVFEGPKKADAAARLMLPACISWTGGANAWHKHDWSPLKGRKVLIWEDADEPGRKARKELAEWLSDPRTLGCSVRFIDTDGQPEGWDVADAEAEGWDTVKLVEWAKKRANDYVHYVDKANPPREGGDLPPLEAYAEEGSAAPLPPIKRGESNVLGEVYYRQMSTVQSRAIDWLWKGRIAKGKVSMIVGNPGLGKSQVTASITSVVSNGGEWPVERTRCAKGSVVILSAEDDPEDTIRPRLEAAGADLDKVYILDAVRVDRQEGDGKRGFDLTVDIGRLGALLHTLGDAALVIIDPITAYLGDADSHNNAEVRALLAPLAEMAASQRVAILAVSHLTKSSGMDALLRVQGSIGFAAAARAVWGVAKDKDNPSRRLFMPLKNNLGTDISGFAYTVEGVRLPDSDIETSHVMWENHLVTMTADEVFGSQDQPHEEREAMLDAKMYLRALLSDGPVAVKGIEADAKGAGHSWATIRRAQKELKIHAYREHGIGERGKWYWRLDG